MRVSAKGYRFPFLIFLAGKYINEVITAYYEFGNKLIVPLAFSAFLLISSIAVMYKLILIMLSRGIFVIVVE